MMVQVETTDQSCIVGDWHGALKARFPESVARKVRTLPYSITSIRDLPTDLQQPALADDVLCLHRGGAKRIHRFRDGAHTVHDVPLNALTLITKHRSARWRTEGPDDCLHVSLSPKAFDEILMGERGVSRIQIDLRDDVGFINPVLYGLALEMERVADEGTETQLYIDTLSTALALALVRHCTGEAQAAAPFGDGAMHVGGMAGWRLREIVDYMHANRGREIQLCELTGVSGLSRAHFFRAFRQSTGMSPGRYFERLRIEDARRLIDKGESLADAARQVGFSGTAVLCRAFRRAMNMTPAQYRRWYR